MGADGPRRGDAANHAIPYLPGLRRADWPHRAGRTGRRRTTALANRLLPPAGSRLRLIAPTASSETGPHYPSIISLRPRQMEVIKGLGGFVGGPVMRRSCTGCSSTQLRTHLRRGVFFSRFQLQPITASLAPHFEAHFHRRQAQDPYCRRGASVRRRSPKSSFRLPHRRRRQTVSKTAALTRRRTSAGPAGFHRFTPSRQASAAVIGYLLQVGPLGPV